MMDSNISPMQGSVPLKGTQRKIIHIDFDAFYASIEMRDNPRLSGRPVAVGGMPERRGVVATCNYEARRFGVRSAMSSAQAMRLCPELKIIPPRFSVYREASARAHDIFRQYTDQIEPLSLDEAYLDVTASQCCRGSATLIAEEIRREVAQKLNVTVSAGVAPNKFLAKIASDWRKPDGLFVITPVQIEDFLFALPVTKIHGVGRVTAGKLQQKGIRTCGQLRQYSILELSRWFGSFGERLWELSRGQDDREVQTGRRRKSLSVERTYDHDLVGLEAAMAQLEPLLTELQERFRPIEKEYQVYKHYVKVKFADFTQTTLEESPPATGEPLAKHFSRLLAGAWGRGGPAVRLLGVGLRLVDLREARALEQLELFERKINGMG